MMGWRVVEDYNEIEAIALFHSTHGKNRDKTLRLSVANGTKRGGLSGRSVTVLHELSMLTRIQ